MAYGDFKDLVRRTVWVKVFCDKLFAIPKNWKLDGNQNRVASMVYNLYLYLQS